ncbi:unnamed protein product [Rangifer tarandus platyrhynchus]|uniref:Uncharacterized protein n=1 Tax=Rangifer tarandus platyrhynchus TaxID=3082113 RepID=A0AC59Z313_RANTA
MHWRRRRHPPQSSCLENPTDGGAWWAAVHGVAESRTRLSDFTLTFHFHALEKATAPTPVLLPGEPHGRGSLVGCSPRGGGESDTTERLHFDFSLPCIGEGDGTHPSPPAWRTPRTGEPGGLQSTGWRRVGHD